MRTVSAVVDPERASVIEILGGKRTLGAGVRREDDLIERIERGLPYKTLESVRVITGIGIALLRDLLGVSERTLQRRQSQKLLTKEESDRLVRLAKLFERTVHVLGDAEEARAWLHRRNIALGDRTPLEIMDTAVGEARVYEVLGRIQHGVYS